MQKDFNVTNGLAVSASHRMMDAKKRLTSISYFCPVFNEAEHIESHLLRVAEVLTNAAQWNEIVVIDDGSTDGTAEILMRLQESIPSLRVVTHSINRGYGCAMRKGLEEVRGEYVFYTDSDGQYDPVDLLRMIDKITPESAIIGRRHDRADNMWRFVQSKVFNRLLQTILGLPVTDINCAFKVFPKKALDNVVLSAEGLFIDAEILFRLLNCGIQLHEEDVTHYPRKHGRSKLNNLHEIAVLLTELYSFQRSHRNCA